MSVWKLVRLDFQTNPVHFGELGIGMEETAERIHSDTLFSAWFSAYARLYPNDIKALFDRFPIDDTSQPIEPPFRVSSTFIYGKSEPDSHISIAKAAATDQIPDFSEKSGISPPNGKSEPDSYIYYLPTLLKLPAGYPHEDVKDDVKIALKFAKAFRKLKFLPLSIWHRWYQGTGIDKIEHEELLNKSGKLAEAGTFFNDKKSTKTIYIYRSQNLPKVAVDRIHSGTNFYQTSFIYFQNGGLYFLFYMPTEDKKLYDKLYASLNLLGDEGIGGERSSGAGRFTAEWLELTTEWKSIIYAKIDRPNRALISLFWDTPDVCYSYIQDENTRYQLQERGGWISARSGRQLRRKSVRMFMEGSIFSQPDGGRLAIVTPDELKGKKHHPIYRSGVSLSLPIICNME
jgi:CRISPR-associated protein Csm4